jgi:ABC-2 type transport system ATP-binding protein
MLDIKNIAKVYPNSKGLFDLSLSVSEGEVVSFIGPNGSGKSTALNIIAGVKIGDGGSCQINGFDTHVAGTKRYIGFLEEEAFYYDNVSVQTFLDFIWSHKYPAESNEDIFRLLERFDLIEKRHDPIKSLSMGMRKRLGIISSIMNHPPLIILDEPTNSIDTEGLLVLKDELCQLKKHNCIIILSGHVLDFLKTVSTRFVFLKDGHLYSDFLNEETMDLDLAYRGIYSI